MQICLKLIHHIFIQFRKSFVHQAILGVSYLHSQGISHGGKHMILLHELSITVIVDLHFNNLGCSLPGLNERTELDLLTHFGNPECVTPILAVDPADQTASLPPYLIPAISMADYLAKAKPPLSLEADPPLLKILDFGGCTLLFTNLAPVNADICCQLYIYSISAGRTPASLTVCSWNTSSWDCLSNDCSGEQGS